MYSTRRRFLQKIKDILEGTFFTFMLFPMLSEYADGAENNTGFDLIALKGGKGPDELFRKGIGHMGGMGRFVKKGQSVLIKPNMGWDRSPEYGANTDPALIGAIVTECFKAGASDVYVLDHTCDSWKSCYKNSRIEEFAKNAGAKTVPASSEDYYVKTPIPRGKKLKEALVHKLFLQCDVVINVPVLKHHSSTSITASMKNLMGVVWDRYEWHRKDLHQCIADFSTLRRPDLCILDGWRVMIKNGPRGYSTSDVVKYEYLFISTDPVAIDSAGAAVLAKTGTVSKNAEDIRYIRLGREYGLGRTDLDKMNIKRITI
jgi:uncharacterized protein (DUF362 family)